MLIQMTGQGLCLCPVYSYPHEFSYTGNIISTDYLAIPS
jgi:hypothetical protein